MFKHLLRFIFKDWIGSLLIPSLLLIPLGWFIVPFAMIWRKEHAPMPSHPTYQEHWKYIKMPDWAWIWETNSGLMGDGSYITTYRWHPTTFMGQYWWTAFRNPMRGWKYRVMGINLDGFQKIQYWGAYEVDDVSGKFGRQFVVTTVGDRTVTGFYGVWRLNSEYCLRLRIGFKVKPSYVKKSRRVGATPFSLSIKRYS